MGIVCPVDDSILRLHHQEGIYTVWISREEEGVVVIHFDNPQDASSALQPLQFLLSTEWRPLIDVYLLCP